MTQSLNPPFVIAPAPRRLYHRPIVRIVPGVAIGRFVYQFRWVLLLGWVCVTVAVVVLAASSTNMVGQNTPLVPEGYPSRNAFVELSRHFADKVGLSQAVVVFERQDGPLTAQDLADVETIADQAAHMNLPRGDGGGGRFSVRSPKSLALPVVGKNPLISDDGKAALILINLPYDFAAPSTSSAVNQLEGFTAAHHFAPGLATAISGSAGYGRDYYLANERSHDKTIVLTLIAVIVILLAVYRAPIAALIPLVGISAATIVALKLLALGRIVGVESGTAERIFVLVLVYGAGVDYSLLFISRYLEFLDQGHTPAEAVQLGLNASTAAILFSGATTIAGLGMLYFAEFGLFHNTGTAVVMALVIAALASLTIVPALIAIIGPRAFWPGRRTISRIPDVSPGIGIPGLESSLAPDIASRRQAKACTTNGAANQSGLALATEPAPGAATIKKLWPTLARAVIRRPGTILLITLLALAVPSVQGSRLTWIYDALASLKPTYSAMRGADMVVRHWPIGEIAPLTVVVVAPRDIAPPEWSAAYAKIADGLRALPGVGDVRGVGTPLGLATDPLQNTLVLMAGRAQVQAEYLSADQRAMRFSVMLKTPPLALAAMEDMASIQSVTQAALAKSALTATVSISGATADMADVRVVTQKDFHRIALLALTAILLLVIALLRDVILAVFMVAATVVSYLATLGLTYWLFHACGYDGLDWKLQIFLFIVLVAVGQDYNIFFAVRLTQELRRLPPVPATEQTIIHTGPVISCCGLIMAATLGSVMAGDVILLVQLGFAFALGMLIDTFIVRPLMLPAFIVVTKRTLRRASRLIR